MLLSCVLTLSQMSSTMLKPREIYHFIQSRGVSHEDGWKNRKTPNIISTGVFGVQKSDVCRDVCSQFLLGFIALCQWAVLAACSATGELKSELYLSMF